MGSHIFSFFKSWSSCSVFLCSISNLFSFMKLKIFNAVSGVTKLIMFFRHPNSSTSSNLFGRLISHVRIFFTLFSIGKSTSDFIRHNSFFKSLMYCSEISCFNCSTDCVIFNYNYVKAHAIFTIVLSAFMVASLGFSKILHLLISVNICPITFISSSEIFDIW